MHIYFLMFVLLAGYGTPTTVTTIKDKSVSESSGLVASRTTPGAYWTHNDSGDGPFIYAFDTRGDSFGTFRVTEPSLSATSRQFTKKRPGSTEPADAIRLKYPDGKHDAEALLVHPRTGNLYIVTKVLIANSAVYEAVAPFTAGQSITMRRIGEVRVPSLFGGVITGGSISPDGRRVALCDYFQGYEIVLPAGSSNFDDIWKQRMVGFDLGKRKQGESITYRRDGKALLATSEGKQSPLIQVLRN